MIKSILAISTLAFLFSCDYPDPKEGEQSSGSLEYVDNNEGEKIIDTMATVNNAGAHEDSTTSSANHTTNKSYNEQDNKTEIVDHDK